MVALDGSDAVGLLEQGAQVEEPTLVSSPPAVTGGRSWRKVAVLSVCAVAATAALWHAPRLAGLTKVSSPSEDTGLFQLRPTTKPPTTTTAATTAATTAPSTAPPPPKVPPPPPVPSVAPPPPPVTAPPPTVPVPSIVPPPVVPPPTVPAPVLPARPAANLDAKAVAKPEAKVGVLGLSAPASVQAANSATIKAITQTDCISAYRSLGPNAIEALAGLVKVSGCGSLPGIYGAVGNGCGKSQVPKKTTACQEAGYTVVPGFVRLILAKNIGSLPDPVLGFVAKYTTGKKDGDGCVAVFRNDAGGAEFANRSKASLVDSPWEDTEGCQIDDQAKEIFVQSIESVYQQFESMGCTKDTNAIFTGRGLGGTVALYAAYDFATQGRKVANSAVFGIPAPGNLAFAESFAKVVGEKTFIHVTYELDSVPGDLPSSQYYNGLCEAYFEAGAKAKDVEICAPITRKACGLEKQIAAAGAKAEDDDSCGFALAPKGDFCKGAKTPETCYLGYGYEDFQKPDTALGLPQAVGLTPNVPTKKPSSKKPSGGKKP